MRVDVLISDIRMPGMDGLALQKLVVENWPECRTLFLTGYPDFDDIQQAMRSGACDYLLKTEGKEIIVRTVRRILASLDEQKARDVADARKARLAELGESMREHFFANLLREPVSLQEVENTFRTLETTLDPTQPVLLCIGRSDGGIPGVDWRSETAMVAVKQLVTHAMEAYYRCIGLMYQPGWLAWLLQPRKEEASAWKHASLYLNETIEAQQEKCRLLLDCTVSFAIAADVCPWIQLSQKRIRLENLLYADAGQEAILIESAPADGHQLVENWLSETAERMDYLNACLEMSNRQEFFQTLDQIVRVVEGLPEDIHCKLRLEILGRLLVVVTAQLNRWNFWEEAEKRKDVTPLYGRLWSMPFPQAVGLLSGLADVIFEIKSSKAITSDEDMVQRLHWIIGQNLGGDLSLPRLGELIGMNPYYMARCYQQSTGERLTNYIATVRFEHARRLVAEGSMLHRDIAKVIGFGSEQAFNRFFKKMSGMAPRDWREKCRIDNQ